MNNKAHFTHRIARQRDIPDIINLMQLSIEENMKAFLTAEEIEANREESRRDNKLVKELVARGFRAQLKTGNLLTGQLYVDLASYADAPPKELRTEEGYTVFPTIPAPLEQIVNRVDNILKKVEKVPFDKIGMDLQLAVESLTKTLDEIKDMSGNINQKTIPKINAAIDQMN